MDDRKTASSQLKTELLSISEFVEDAVGKIHAQLDSFNLSAEDLAGWRVFVLKLSERTQRHAFVQKSRRVIPVDAVTQRADLQAKRKKQEEDKARAERVKRLREKGFQPAKKQRSMAEVLA